MNFGRDARAIHKHLKGRGMAISSDLGDPIKYIESMIKNLRGNENVIDYIPCPPNYITTLFLVTDSGKLLFSEVITTVTPGVIFDKTEITYDPRFYLLSSLREEETLIETLKEDKLFGTTWDNIIMYFDEGSLDLKVKKGEGKGVYKSILTARKKLMPKPDKPKPTKAKTKAPEAQSNGSDAIESIRKMYEDGLITKEEMMELLKASLAK